MKDWREVKKQEREARGDIRPENCDSLQEIESMESLGARAAPGKGKSPAKGELEWSYREGKDGVSQLNN